MTTFITRYETSGPGVRLAVKDLIDMEGEPTTAGCRAVAARAVPAAEDAACLAGARAAGARIVGRTNLHELALGVTGVNQWYGTPVNPLDPTRVPGGSSSGSAVAVATGEADVAYGSDTGGSVRIPAACCGTAGLKTTWGRIPLDGVWPLAPSFDTVGPMARTVAGLVTRDAVARAGLHRSPRCAGTTWSSADCRWRRIRPSPRRSTGRSTSWGGTAATSRSRGGTTPPCRRASSWWSRHGSPTPRWWRRTPRGSATTCAPGWSSGARSTRTPCALPGGSSAAWKATLERIFTEVDLLVTPTLSIFPPRLEDGDDLLVSRCTLPVNLAGVPGPVASGADDRALARQHAADRAGRQRGAAAGGGGARSKRPSRRPDVASSHRQ